MVYTPWYMNKVFENINSFEKWKAFAEHYKFRCVYCDLDFLSSPNAYSSADVDHFYPKSLGGKGVVPACRLCNSLKKKRVFKSIEEGRKILKKLREEYLKKYEFEELRKKHRT